MIIPIQSRRSFNAGLGASGAATAQQTVVTGGAILTAAAPSIWGASTAASVAIPIIGIGVAAVTLAIGLFLARKGPAQKIATTKVAEYYEPLMKQNLEAYLNGPRTRSSQARCVANYDALWADLIANCQTAANGEPGQRCVTDRQAGACKWQDVPGHCWNWFVGYRDPIANDPDVVVDPSQEIASSADSVISSVFPNATPSQRSTYLLLASVAALAVLAVAVGGD